MPISTNLNIQPYNDDFNNSSQYYKVLFKPGVSVQARELNTVQSILQNQIEQFGDNIFSNGTIIQGCNFVTYTNYSYIKIKDVDSFGLTTNPSAYKNLAIINEATGLRAIVINFADGYEINNPDLKTLYLQYKNTGFDGTNWTSTFTAGDVLTVFNPVYNGIEQVTVDDGGLGFANTDAVVAIPSIAITNTGAFTPGSYVTNGLGANLQIASVNTTALANSGQIVLSLQPRAVDLANASSNSTAWTISNNDTITLIGGTATGFVNNLIGVGFRGKIVTDATGAVQTMFILSKGFGYTFLPYISIRSPGNSSGYAGLNLVPQNYIATVTVAAISGSVGLGYAFGVTEGVVFQKGYFLTVPAQTIVVDKYNTNPSFPNNVVVGFATEESIIDYNLDQSLNDPASTDNAGAPGADRLMLKPVLVTSDPVSAAANADFFVIAGWSEGQLFKQNQQTIYSTIGDTMAARTYEQSGDFVTDQFLVTTRSPLDTTKEGSLFNIVVDPGITYIDGYRVPTYKNFVLEDAKGLDTASQDNYNVSLNYGNYIIIDNVGGVFQWNIGETVYLYDTAKGFLANSALVKAGNTSPVGNVIGTALIRAMSLLDNRPGTSTAAYKLYIFNIQMANGCSFADVNSVYANTGSSFGIGDIVPDLVTSNNYGAVLYDSNNSFMVFPTRVESLQNATDVSYSYRTVDTTRTISNTGIITKNISGNPNEQFPYSGALSSGNLTDLYIVPTEVDLLPVANATGTVNVASNSAIVTGNSTIFMTELAVGDFIYIYNTAAYDLKQVVGIVNATSITVDSNVSFSNTASHIVRVFPNNVPIPLGYRSGLSANVDTGQTTLTINLGTNLNDTVARKVTIGYNVQRNLVAQATKAPVRQRFVKICCANNLANTTGPWCLGIPDIFRLRGVWVGNSTVTNTGTNLFQSFYIDNNQNADYYGLGYLCNQPTSVTPLTSAQYLLVEFDYFTCSSPGFYDTVSYVGSDPVALAINDSLSLTDLTSNNVVNTFEIPSFFTGGGLEVDLIRGFDFRPYNTATCAPNIAAVAAPINPLDIINLGATDKKFPLPDSTFTCDISYYLGRTDTLLINKQSQIYTLTGIADATNRVAPVTPAATMKLTEIYIPAYPNLSALSSPQLNEILDTKVFNQRYLTGRLSRASITTQTNQTALPFNQPKNYTMADIGNIDRRLQSVEYYVSLNSLEGSVINMTIPSSVDPTANRFKFGYFADDFTSQGLSDLNDPQYAATKELTDIVPSKILWDLSLNGGVGTIDYIDTLLISQENATVGVVVANTPNTPVPNTPTHNTGPVCVTAFDNVVAYTTSYRSWTNNPNPVANSAIGNNFVTDAVTYTFVDTSQLQSLYSLQNTDFSGLKNTQVSAATVAELQALAAVFTSHQTEHFAGMTNDQIIAAALASIGTGAMSFGKDQPGGRHGPWIVPTPGSPSIWDLFPFLTSLPTELFFYNYDNPTRIDVLQSGSPVTMVASTSSGVPVANQPNPLTAAEKTTLLGINSNYWFNDQPNLYMFDAVQSATMPGFWTGCGKVTFNYNAQLGASYQVQTTTQKGTNQRWRWAFAYPISGASVGCIPGQEQWDYIIYGGCTNSGLSGGAWWPVNTWQNMNKGTKIGTTGGISASVAPFDINSMWAGGSSVTASGVAYTGKVKAVGRDIGIGWFGAIYSWAQPIYSNPNNWLFSIN